MSGIADALEKAGMVLPVGDSTIMPEVVVNRGDVFLVELSDYDFNSFVQQSRRPMLVIQNDMGNKHSPTIICAAITSKSKKAYPMHMPIELSCSSTVLFEQLFTVDKSRLIRKIGQLSQAELMEVDSKISISLGNSHLSVMEITSVRVSSMISETTRVNQVSHILAKVGLRSTKGVETLVKIDGEFLLESDSLDTLESKLNTLRGLKILVESMYVDRRTYEDRI